MQSASQSLELVHVCDAVTDRLTGTEGALPAPVLAKIFPSAADALDAQEVTIHATSVSGETELFRFHGSTKVRCLRKAVEEAKAAEQAEDVVQRQRVRLVYDGTELKDDSATLSGIGFSFEQPALVTTIVERCSLDGILRHFYVAVEVEEWRLDALCDLHDALGTTETIVICSQQCIVDMLIRTMASRELYVWRIAGDTQGGQHVGIYSPDTYRSSTNRMLIITSHDLNNLHSPEGVRALINYNVRGGSELEFEREDEDEDGVKEDYCECGSGSDEDEDGVKEEQSRVVMPWVKEADLIHENKEDYIKSYIWQFGQFSGDRAIVINFVTAWDQVNFGTGLGAIKDIEDALQIKIDEMPLDIAEYFI